MWALAGFIVAVIGGVIGCILLLLKKSVSIYIFAASFIGVIAMLTHSLRVDVEFGIGEIVAIIVLPFVVAAFLIWYAYMVTIKNA